MLIVQIDGKRYVDIVGNKRTLKEWKKIYGESLEISRHAYLARKNTAYRRNGRASLVLPVCRQRNPWGSIS